MRKANKLGYGLFRHIGIATLIGPGLATAALKHVPAATVLITG